MRPFFPGTIVCAQLWHPSVLGKLLLAYINENLEVAPFDGPCRWPPTYLIFAASKVKCLKCIAMEIACVVLYCVVGRLMNVWLFACTATTRDEPSPERRGEARRR